MSKKIKVSIPCPHCHNSFEATLYRSIWGEYPENREIVFNDTINSPICPHCKNKVIIGNASLLYHNAKEKFAVWYEPVHDSAIDADCKGYTQMFGPDNYLATAPRISDWEGFKRTIVMFEKGDLKKGNAGEISPELKNQFDGFVKSITSEQKKAKNSGCLLVIIIAILISAALLT